MLVNLKVKRHNPESGAETPPFTNYSVEIPEHSTLLDSLIHVRDYEDGTLALRYSCRSSICGSCSMRVDGRAQLACKVKVTDLVKEEGQEITIEPMGNMPVIKDLVVDMGEFWSKVQQITPWLQPTGPEPERENLVPHENMMELAKTMNCIMCGACVSDCPVLNIDTSFIAPAALAKAFRFVGDPRDGTDKERLQQLTESGGIWDCTRCNICVEVCPKDVRPMDQIMKLRERAIEAGITGSTGARHGKAFVSSVQRLGRLDEMRLLPESVGFWNVPRLLSEMPGAFRMLRAGKLPWSHALPWHKPIAGIKHVRRLFDRSRDKK